MRMARLHGGIRMAVGLAALGMLASARPEERPAKKTWGSEIQAGPSRFKTVCDETTCTLERLALPDRTGWRLTTHLPSGPAANPTMETVSLRGKKQSVHAVIPLARNRAWEVVVDLEVDPPAVVWQGGTGASGPEGEGIGDVLSIEDWTGDGIADVVVGKARIGVAVCGQKPALLFPRAYDPGSGRFLPVSLNRLRGTAPAKVTIQATRKGPIQDLPPPLFALATPASASSVEGDEESPLRLDPPWQVLDRDPATVWIEGRPGSGEGEFITLRIAAEAYPVAALALVPSPALPKAQAAAFSRPRRFDLVVGERRFDVVLDEDPVRHPGQAYWIPLPAVQDAGCVTLIIRETYPAKGPWQRTALAEVVLYSELDLSPDPVATVLADLDDPGKRRKAAAALETVARGHEDRLVAAMDALESEARAVVLRVLARTAPDRVLDLLVQDLSSGDPEARRSAAAALAEAGEAAMPALSGAVAEPGPGTGDALEAFGAMDASLAISGVVEAISRSPADEGHLLVLRAALASAMERIPDENLAPLLPPLAGGLTPDRRLWVIEALPAGVPDLATWTRNAIRSLLASREGFEASYRKLRLAGRWIDGKDASWAGGLLPYTEDESDVIRSAALDALALCPSGIPEERVPAWLADSSPRVRSSTLGLAANLASCGGARSASAIRHLAHADPWPLVRARALESLRRCRETRAMDAALAAIKDPSWMVRKTAVEILATIGGPDAMAALTSLVADVTQPASVKALAAIGLGRACWSEADEPLADLLLESIRHWNEPGFDDAGFAAVTALAALGGPAARQALELAVRRGPPALQKAAMLAEQGESRCDPGVP